MTKSFAVSATIYGNLTWDFKFFHKPLSPSALVEFRQAVKRCLAPIVNPNHATDLLPVMLSASQQKKINKAYATALRKIPRENINTTSLCVYSGSEFSTSEGSDISEPWPNPIIGARPVFREWPHSMPYGCSLLYTGDADFSLAANRDELRGFLEIGRWEKVAIFQVPHHGSINNWEFGSASEFSHSHSVFCADEYNMGYQHPRREVVLDLLHHSPIIANKEIGWSWHGTAWFQ